MATEQIMIEGMPADELLRWPIEQLRSLLDLGRPIVFRAGTATVLAQVKITDRRLTIDLAHIDGGGEGVLPMLWRFGQRYADLENVLTIEWLVHAAHCATPSVRLSQLLLKMAFKIEKLAERGEVYRRVDERGPTSKIFGS